MLGCSGHGGHCAFPEDQGQTSHQFFSDYCVAQMCLFMIGWIFPHCLWKALLTTLSSNLCKKRFVQTFPPHPVKNGVTSPPLFSVRSGLTPFLSLFLLLSFFPANGKKRFVKCCTSCGGKLVLPTAILCVYCVCFSWQMWKNCATCLHQTLVVTALWL